MSRILRLVEKTDFSAQVKKPSFDPTIPKSRARRAVEWVGRGIKKIAKGALNVYAHPVYGAAVAPLARVAGQVGEHFAGMVGGRTGKVVEPLAFAAKIAGIPFLRGHASNYVYRKKAEDAITTTDKKQRKREKFKAQQAGAVAMIGTTAMDTALNYFLPSMSHVSAIQTAARAADAYRSRIPRGRDTRVRSDSSGVRSHWGESRFNIVTLIESDRPLIEVTRSRQLMGKILSKRLRDVATQVQSAGAGNIANTKALKGGLLQDVVALAKKDKNVGKSYAKLKNSVARVKRHMSAEYGQAGTEHVKALLAAEHRDVAQRSNENVSLPSVLQKVREYSRSASEKPFRNTPNRPPESMGDKIKRRVSSVTSSVSDAARASASKIKSGASTTFEKLRSFFSKSDPKTGKYPIQR